MTKDKNHTKSRTKKGKFGTALIFVTLFVLGGLVGFGLDPILGFLGLDLGEADASPWVVIPGLIASIFFVLAFHEAGHIIGGKLVGFRFTLFVVGPIKLHSAPGGIKLGLNRSLMLAGGLGGAAPTDSRNLARRMTAFVAGGPVASLLLAVSAFGLFFIAPPSIGIILSIVALASLGIGVVTLIPNRAGGLVSDGARLKMLREGGPEAVRWSAIGALDGASMAGDRPRDWDEDLIQSSLAHRDNSFDDAGASSTAYYHTLDLGRKDEAEALLERALRRRRPGDDALPDAHRSRLLPVLLPPRRRRSPGLLLPGPAGEGARKAPPATGRGGDPARRGRKRKGERESPQKPGSTRRVVQPRDGETGERMVRKDH